MRFLLLLLALALPSAASAVPGPCLTPELLPHTPPPRPFPAATARDKDSRNPYSVPNERVTDDFVIRWGNDWTQNLEGIEVLAEALQDAWETQIVELAHPEPPSTDSTRMNVYIGDTGSGAPSAFGAGGYFSGDEEGYPMLVVAQQSLDQPGWTRVVALHEFYHSVQWGLDTYTYDEGSPGAWYWEASATWIPTVTDADSVDHGRFLFGFGLLPHLSLDAFDYPDSGALDEYHQYGAFIFLTFLSESGFDADVVRDSWVEPTGGTNDPIEALRGRLSQEDADFDALFGEFAATNVFWDYEQQAYWEAVIDAGMQAYPDASPVTAWADPARLGEWLAPPTSRQPNRYGANVLRLDSLPASGEWRLRARFDDVGSQGSAAEWAAVLVRRQGGSVSYQPVSGGELADGVEVDPSGELALSVAVWSGDRRNNERFAWEWMIEDPSGDDDDAADDDDDAADDDDDRGLGGAGSGCRCTTSRPAGGPSLLLVLGYGMLAPLLRRRSAASARRVPSGNSAAKSV